tara:strand:+ start:725 stop:985 length:261 start_codon:yes stop_codon:yes gene_type:complete
MNLLSIVKLKNIDYDEWIYIKDIYLQDLSLMMENIQISKVNKDTVIITSQVSNHKIFKEFKAEKLLERVGEEYGFKCETYSLEILN